MASNPDTTGVNLNKRKKEVFERAGAHDISYTEEEGVPKHEERRV
jgi:hypothetical protein